MALEPEVGEARFVAIRNLRLEPQADHVVVVFDVAWRDSWRNRAQPGMCWDNWDAAWIFLKFRSRGEGGRGGAYETHFRHGFLSPDSAHHGAPEGCTVQPVPDGAGVFLHRSRQNLGEGPVAFSDVRLRWQPAPGADPLSFPVDLWVLGVEMVYVPPGPFRVGDPDGPAGPDACFHDPLIARQSPGIKTRAWRPALGGAEDLSVELDREDLTLLLVPPWLSETDLRELRAADMDGRAEMRDRLAERFERTLRGHHRGLLDRAARAAADLKVLRGQVKELSRGRGRAVAALRDELDDLTVASGALSAEDIDLAGTIDARRRGLELLLHEAQARYRTARQALLRPARVRILSTAGRPSTAPPALVPPEFPKGVAGFYCMKRQVSQGDYADFMNIIAGEARTVRFPYGGQAGYRYTVFRTPDKLRAATRPHRACNWLSWGDGAAWLWWAGLRPMTELEYEKGCRGPGRASPGEFAWGSTWLERSKVVMGPEDGQEVVSGNAHIGAEAEVLMGGDGGQGPVRDDAFGPGGEARYHAIYPTGRGQFGRWSNHPTLHPLESKTHRERCGLSFYGIAGLTGNLWEMVVNTGDPAGRMFAGDHGNGRLDASGRPDAPLRADISRGVLDGDGAPGPELVPGELCSWPPPTAQGIGYRGGSWYTAVDRGPVASRRYALGIPGFALRSHDSGIRGVRTAPPSVESG